MSFQSVLAYKYLAAYVTSDLSWKLHIKLPSVMFLTPRKNKSIKSAHKNLTPSSKDKFNEGTVFYLIELFALTVRNHEANFMFNSSGNE